MPAMNGNRIAEALAGFIPEHLPWNRELIPPEYFTGDGQIDKRLDGCIKSPHLIENTALLSHELVISHRHQWE